MYRLFLSLLFSYIIFIYFRMSTDVLKFHTYMISVFCIISVVPNDLSKCMKIYRMPDAFPHLFYLLAPSCPPCGISQFRYLSHPPLLIFVIFWSIGDNVHVG